MKKACISLETLSKTQFFGEMLGKIAVAGDIYCLNGELGAGKTTLTQSIARGLDVPDSYYVTSPSFAVLHEYPGRIPLYHMDFYRLGDEMEVEGMGLEEYLYSSGLSVIEWSDKAKEILPDSSLTMKINVVSEKSRIVEYQYDEHHWQSRLEDLSHRLKAIIID